MVRPAWRNQSPPLCYPASRTKVDSHLPDSSQHPFTLGPWRVEPRRGILASEDGGETRLEPQLMDLLVLFAGAPGEVFSKDRIIASVWGGRAIGDDTLAAAVSRLRNALGQEKFIETIPKRGYRLIVVPDNARGDQLRGGPHTSLVAQGFAILKAPLPHSLGQARLYFEAAIREDAADAHAHAGLAQTLLLQHLMGHEPNAALARAALASAHAALALDEHLALAWAVQGFAILLLERDFARADDSLQRALACDSASGIAHRYRALALAAAGRYVDAERECRSALKLDPVSLSLRGELAQYLLLARRYIQAIDEAKRTIQMAPQSGEAWFAKGWAHAMLGADSDALSAFQEGLKAWGLSTEKLAQLSNAHREGGSAALCSPAADLFESQAIGFIPRTTDIAVLRAFAGDDDAAFAAFDKAVARDDPYLLWALRLPQLDRLRNDPRFPSLLERARVLS